MSMYTHIDMKKEKQITRILFAYSELYILVDGNMSDSILYTFTILLYSTHTFTTSK